MPNPTFSLLLRYAVAAACMVTAVGVRVLLNPVFGDAYPFATLFLSVLLAAWYGGFGPAVLATALGAIISVRFLLPPYDAFAIANPGHIAALLLYTTVSLGVAALGGAMRSANEARRRLAAIVEFSDDAIIAKDLDGIITSWNAGAERVYGYTAEGILGQPFALLVPPDHAAEIENSLERLRRGEQLSHYETVRKRKDGTLIDVSVSYSPIKSVDGALLGAAVITRDVTERKRSEAAIRERQRQLQLVADNAPVLIAHCSAEQRYKFVNKPYAERFGLHPREVIGRTIPEVLGEEAFAVLAPHIADVLTGRHVDFEAAIPYRELGEQQMHCAYEPEFDVEGRVVGYIAALTNVTERVRVERALREVEARFAAIVNHSPASIFAKDRQGRFLLANDALARMLGCRPEDIPGKTDADFSPPEACRQFARDDAAVFATGESLTLEETFSAGGSTLTMLTVKFPLRDAMGNVYAVCGIATDVTELKRAEEALQAAADRLSLALSAAHMGDWSWDAHSDLVNLSGRAAEIFGIPPGPHMTWKDMLNLVEEKDRAATSQKVQQALRSQGLYSAEYRVNRPGGEQRWVAASGRAHYAPTGEPLGMYGIVHDITQRKRVEQDIRFLADASATLAALVDYGTTLRKVAELAVPTFADWCTVDMLDDEGALQRLAVAHVDPAKVSLAQDLHRRFPPDPAAPGGLWEIIRTGESKLIPVLSDELLTARLKDSELLGAFRQLGMKSYMGVALKVRGRVLGVITFFSAESGRRYTPEDLAVAEDLAHRAAVAVENARLYQEVREADRKKDEFLAVLGHELRNPLAPISNALQILKLPDASGPVLEQAREMMERQVHYMVRLVDDLLDVSRIVRGKVELRRESVDLATVITRAVETSQPFIDAEQHELTVNLPSEPLRVSGDPVRLAQVIANLLNNAARYTERRGKISVSAQREGNRAVLRVRDTGIGIAPDALSQIWDMFVQADRRMKGAQGGMGIGLTLVKSLVEMHGGSVAVASEGLGRGSEFIVSLPLLQPERAGNPSGNADGQGSAAAARRVLVVDDNVDAALSLAMLLRVNGHQSEVANDGPAALRLAEAHPPEIAFLDIGMPGMDGYELARRFRDNPRLANVLLVALTGWGQEEDRRRTRAAGFDAHEVKPVTIEALQKLLHRQR